MVDERGAQAQLHGDGMTGTIECRYYGRDFTAQEMALLRALIAADPQPTRAALSREFCRRIGWFKPDGGLKDMMAKVTMLAMHRDGLIELPAPTRRHNRPRPIVFGPDTEPPLFPAPTALDEVRPLDFRIVVRGTREGRLWNEFVARHHYLGYKTLVGAQMRYAVHDRNGWPIAMLGFSTAAWKLAPRDNFIGWTPQKREKNLPLVVDKRCDLIAVRRAGDGSFRMTCIEVKTTGEAALPDEAALVDHAADQIEQTAAALSSAVSGDGPFAAPRSEMLKEVLVRTASNRWGADEDDVAQRKIWGPLLKDLFNDNPEPPVVRVDGEIVVVKLRSTEPARVTPLGGRQIPITVRTITERAAEELFDNDFVEKAAPETAGSDHDNRQPHDRPIERPVPPREESASPADDVSGTEPDPTAGTIAERAADLRSGVEAGPSPRGVWAHTNRLNAADAADGSTAVDGASEATAEEGTGAKPVWPPQVNALGMIGQYEIARELQNQARKAKGWGERFLDKLFVGPAGVGKTTLARRIAKQLLGLEPIIFNGADLRRPEMIVDRLVELDKVPADPTGAVEVAPCLIFIDEVHALTSQVSTVLLSALDERRNTTIGNVVYSFEDVVFLLATTDPGKLSEAFQSRPDKTMLRSYTLEEMAGIVWLRSVDKLGQAGLSRETCIEISARMQCSPQPSVNILEPLVASFYGTAEHRLGRVPTREEVADLMNASAVARWFEDTLGIDRNGLTSEHVEYLKLLRTRGASAEDEIRRALGISNRADFVIVSEYLTRLDLIQVGPGGRSLTSGGRRYLTASSPPDLRDRISRRIN